jgi:PAS domain S-box-containing protein
MTEKEKATEAEVTERTARLLGEGTPKTIWLQQEAAEEYCESILESISDGFWVFDREWRCTYINNRQAQRVGMLKEDVAGKNVWELFPDLIGTEVYRQLHRAVAEQTPVHFEHFYPMWQGWFEIRVYPSANGVSLLTIDITERKQIEEALKVANQRISNIVESITDPFVTFDCQWRYGYVNQEAARLLKRSPEELVGKRWQDVFPEAAQSNTFIAQELERAVAEQVTVKFEAFCVAVNRWLEISAFPFPDGLTVYFRDISDAYRQAAQRIRAEAERQQLLEQIRTEREFLEAVLQQMPAGVMVADASSGDILLSNERIKQIWRMPSLLPIDNLERREGYEGFHPDGRPYQQHEWPLFRAVKTGEVVTDEEIAILRGDGTRGIMLVNSAPICDSQGNIKAGVVTFYDISDRKRTQEALARSQQELADFVENVAVGLHWVGADGTILWANQCELDLLGYSRQEYIGHHITEFHADQKAIDDILQRLNSNETLCEYEARLRHKDGSIRYVSINSNVFWEDGKFVHTRCFSQDITARKRAEEALRESEVRLQAILDNARTLVYLKDLDGRYLLVNRQFEEAFNISKQEFIGKTDYDFFSQEMADALRANDKLVLEGKSIEFEEIAPHADGPHTYISVKFPLHDASGNVYASCGISTDINQRKRIENALRENQERLSIAQQTGRLGVFELNLQTHQNVWSPEVEALYGLKPGEFESTYQGWIDRLHPDDREKAVREMDRAYQTDEYSQDFRVIWPDGSIHWLYARAKIFFDTAGKPLRMLGVNVDITERKQLEEALRQSEERLRLAVDAARMVAWTWDARTDTIVRSQTATEVLGLPPEAIRETGVQGWNLVHPEDLASHQAIVQEAIASKGSYVSEFRSIRPDNGSVIWLEDRGRVTCDAAGNLMRIEGALFDISDRKQAELQLEESQRFIQQIADATPGALYIYDLIEQRNVYVNHQIVELLGYTPEQIQTIGSQLFPQLMHPDDFARLPARIERFKYAKDDEVIEGEYRMRHANGEWRWFWSRDIIFTRTDDGLPRQVLGTAQDITDRKRAEVEIATLNRNLQNRVNELQTLFEVIPIGILIAEDLEFKHVRANPAFAEILGIPTDGNASSTPPEGDPHPSYKIFHNGKQLTPDETPLRYAAIYGVEIRGAEVDILRHDGTLFNLYGYAAPLFDEQGKVRGSVGTFLDISDRKRAEAEREQLLARERAAREEAEAANRIKDEFLAVLSHELRSPLNPILGWTRLLRTRKFDAQATDRALETIERNAKLQTQLIGDLLDVSRILQGKMALNVCPVNLVNTIEAALETVQLAAQTKGIDIHAQLAPDVEAVCGDPARLQQIVWNLLSNAVKFTPAGGRVEVRLETVDASAQIQVKDTGKGIAREFLPHVFEYFRQEDSTTTRTFGGLGLGLAIVRHLTQLHGGIVRAESLGEGLGATFTVRLPLMVASLAARESNALSATPTNLSQLQILVVDDEVDMRELAITILEEAGAVVRVAASATEALLAFDRFKPDVLICDIGMPDVNGYMLMHQIRSRSPEQGGQIPAVALTAYAAEYDQQQALAAGFQLHISKPVEPEALVKAIANLIARGSQTSSD